MSTTYPPSQLQLLIARCLIESESRSLEKSIFLFYARWETDTRKVESLAAWLREIGIDSPEQWGVLSQKLEDHFERNIAKFGERGAAPDDEGDLPVVPPGAAGGDETRRFFDFGGGNGGGPKRRPLRRK